MAHFGLKRARGTWAFYRDSLPPLIAYKPGTYFWYGTPELGAIADGKLIPWTRYAKSLSRDEQNRLAWWLLRCCGRRPREIGFRYDERKHRYYM